MMAVMDFVVQKYGGTSVGSLDRIRLVADHVAATKAGGVNVVVVVSAMGDQTDELIAMAKTLSPSPPRRELDMLVTAGERVSMALLSIALHERGLRSVSLTGSQSGILTDENHGNARIEKILGDRIRQALETNSVVIVAGFQGVSPRTREVTTLGRGGSDLSAIALASVLGARSCELYKDVDGIYSADPRQVPGARKINSLPWFAMAEMAWAGAGIIHARAAHVASRFGIRVEVRSSFNLTETGTVIEPSTESDVMMSTSSGAIENAVVHAITCKRNMCLIQLSLKNSNVDSDRSDNVLQSAVALMLDHLWSHGEAPSINQFSNATASLLVPETVGGKLVEVVKEKLGEKLRESDGLLNLDIVETGIAALTVVGNGFLQNPETVSGVLKQVNTICRPSLWDVRNQSMTIGVSDGMATAVMAALHSALIN